MNIKGIISISGMPGLYKIVTQTKFGLVVESLSDGRRVPVYASQKVSALEDISIYTTDEDMPLKDVFQKIYDKENGGKAIDHKSGEKEIRNYFEEVLPEFDKDRVYTSDIKKVYNWYNTLHEKDMLNLPEDEETEESQDEAPADEKKSKAKKEEDSGEEKKKTPAKKKTAAKKATGTKTAAKKTAAKSAKTKASPSKTSGGRKSTGTPRKTGG